MSMLTLIRNIEEMGTALEAAKQVSRNLGKSLLCRDDSLLAKESFASRVQSHASLKIRCSSLKAVIFRPFKGGLLPGSQCFNVICGQVLDS